MRKTKSLLLVPAALCASLPAAAERGNAWIQSVFPGAVSRGKTTEVTLVGRYILSDAYRVMFEGSGVSAAIGEWTEVPDLKRPKPLPGDRRRFENEELKLKVTVAEDALPGIRQFRVITKGSISTVAEILISDVPAITETEPNDSREEAQVIKIPQVVNGWIDKDADLDVFKFQANAGDHVSFIVHAARLQFHIPALQGMDYSDLVLRLTDDRGEELATADDWYGPDPQLYYAFTRAGTYYLEVREARYQSGKSKWWYALSALTSPQVTSIFPMAANPGQKVKLHPNGFNLEGLEEVEIDVPPKARDKMEFQLKSPRGASNVVTLRITDLPRFVRPEKLGPVTIQPPVGIDGCLANDRQVDTYRFHARRGQGFEFEIEARRYGSVLDALLELRDVHGKLLAAKDDEMITVGLSGSTVLSFPEQKDPRLQWTAPADGDYAISVRDPNFFGDRDFVYHLAARLQQPDFTLILDDDRMWLGPGESIGRVVTIERRNGFKGPVRLSVRGLPRGVIALDSFIPEDLDQGNVVLNAEPGAPVDAANVEVVGTADIADQPGRTRKIERTAAPYGIIGTASRTLLPVHTATVAVTNGADIVMEASQTEITLRPGQSVTFDVKITRSNYTGPIELNVILWNLLERYSKLPNGIVLDENKSRTSLKDNESSGRITLRALPDAPPLTRYLMVVLGQITYNRVFMTRTVAPFRLTVSGQAENGGSATGY